MDIGSIIIPKISDFAASSIVGRFTKGKLNIDICRHTITNYMYVPDNKTGNALVEVLLRVSNSGKRSLGISKIYIRPVDKKKPPLDTRIYEYIYSTEMMEPMNSILLKPEETKMIMLIDVRNVFEEEKLDIEVEFYDSKFKIMEKIPLTLYGGNRIHNCEPDELIL